MRRTVQSTIQMIIVTLTKMTIENSLSIKNNSYDQAFINMDSKDPSMYKYRMATSDHFKFLNYSVTDRTLLQSCGPVSYFEFKDPYAKVQPTTNTNIVCFRRAYRLIYFISPVSKVSRFYFPFAIEQNRSLNMVISVSSKILFTLGDLENIGKGKVRIKCYFFYFDYVHNNGITSVTVSKKLTKEEDLEFQDDNLEQRFSMGEYDIRSSEAGNYSLFWKKSDILKIDSGTKASDFIIFCVSMAKIEDGGRRTTKILNLRKGFGFFKIHSKEILATKNGQGLLLILGVPFSSPEVDLFIFELTKEMTIGKRLNPTGLKIASTSPGFIYSNRNNSILTSIQFYQKNNKVKIQFYNSSTPLNPSLLLERDLTIPLKIKNYTIYVKEGDNYGNTIKINFFAKSNNMNKFSLIMTYKISKIEGKDKIIISDIEIIKFSNQIGIGLMFPLINPKTRKKQKIYLDFNNNGDIISKSDLPYKPGILSKIRVNTIKPVLESKSIVLKYVWFNLDSNPGNLKEVQYTKYKFALDQDTINFPNFSLSQTLFKSKLVRMNTVNANSFEKSYFIKVKSNDKRIELFNQKSNDFKLVLLDSANIPYIDQAYFVKGGIIGVINRIKIFYLRCSFLISSNEGFEFTYVCSNAHEIAVNFFKMDVKRIEESDNHIAIFTQVFDNREKNLIVVNKTDNKARVINVEQKYDNFCFVEMNKQQGFYYILYAYGIKEVEFKYILYKEGEFKDVQIGPYKNFIAIASECKTSIELKGEKIYSYIEIIKFCKDRDRDPEIVQFNVVKKNDVMMVYVGRIFSNRKYIHLSLYHLEGKKFKMFTHDFNFFICTEKTIYHNFLGKNERITNFDFFGEKFESITKVINFRNLMHFVVAGKIINSTKTGILVLYSKFNKGVYFDFFEYNFLQENPDLIQAFDVSPREGDPRIVVSVKNFADFYYRVIELNGPKIFVRCSKDAKEGERNFTAFNKLNPNRRKNFTVKFRFLNTSDSVISTEPAKTNFTNGQGLKYYNLKDLLKIKGHVTSIKVGTKSKKNANFKIERERVSQITPQMAGADLKNCSSSLKRDGVVVAICYDDFSTKRKKTVAVFDSSANKVYEKVLKRDSNDLEYLDILDFSMKKLNPADPFNYQKLISIILIMKKYPNGEVKVQDNEKINVTVKANLILFEEKNSKMKKIEEREVRPMVYQPLNKNFNVTRMKIYSNFTVVEEPSGKINYNLYIVIATRRYFVEQDSNVEQAYEAHIYHVNSSNPSKSTRAGSEKTPGYPQLTQQISPGTGVKKIFATCSCIFPVNLNNSFGVIYFQQRSLFPLYHFLLVKNDSYTNSVSYLSTFFEYEKVIASDCIQRKAIWQIECVFVKKLREIVIKYYTTRTGTLNNLISDLNKTQIYRKHTTRNYTKVRLGDGFFACLVIEGERMPPGILVYKRKKAIEVSNGSSNAKKTVEDCVYYGLALDQFVSERKYFSFIDFFFDKDQSGQEILTVFNSIQGKYQNFSLGDAQISLGASNFKNLSGEYLKFENMEEENSLNISDMFVLRKPNQTGNPTNGGTKSVFTLKNIFLFFLVSLFFSSLAYFLVWFCKRRNRLIQLQLQEMEKHMVYSMEDYQFES